MDEFERELMAAFALEAVEHVQGMTAGLLDLERGVVESEGEPLLVRVYRQAHSLKGAARTVGLGPVEHVCQALENVFAAMRSGQLEPTPGLWDELQLAVAALERLLANPADPDVTTSEIVERVRQFVDRPPPPRSEKMARPSPPTPLPQLTEPPPPPLPAPTQTVPALAPPVAPAGVASSPPQRAEAVIRVQVRKVEALFAHSEELIGATFAHRARLADLRALLVRVAAWRKALEDEELTREAPPLGDQVVGMVRSMLAEVRELEQRMANDCVALERQVRDLTDAARAVLLQPVGGALEPFHKLVRDLARDQGKTIQMVVQDGGISVDRRILEALRDPLLHMLRNAADHGIETEDERRAAGKPAGATIRLTARHVGVDTVELRVEDDGRGFDLERLRERACELGLADRADLSSWSDAAVAELAFASELSTADRVTALSGRGLGLSIVRQAMGALGGTAHIASTSPQGSVFLLRLPVTLASFRGVVVYAGGAPFIIPSRMVERALRWLPQSLGTVTGTSTLAVDGVQLPTHHLAQLLGLGHGGAPKSREATGLVVQVGSRRVVLVVDQLAGEQEGLVKGLGVLLRKVRGVSGVATLAGHALVPVLDPGQLLRGSYGQEDVGPTTVSGGTTAASEKARLTADRTATIAVAEDSATARLLLVHVLESAGYKVRTAANGAEALLLLQSEHCDALISDVEMPVMNGFDLTAAVRADPKLAELPVILVTSLESKSDRSRGAQVGANAYVVKRNFEPSVLLQALEHWL